MLPRRKRKTQDAAPMQTLPALAGPAFSISGSSPYPYPAAPWLSAYESNLDEKPEEPKDEVLMSGTESFSHG
jgi:hypothetical protein